MGLCALRPWAQGRDSWGQGIGHSLEPPGAGWMEGRMVYSEKGGRGSGGRGGGRFVHRPDVDRFL